MHIEMFALMQSLKEHGQLPVTFDGEIPELVFGKVDNRLLIGNRYMIPLDVGKEVPGELMSAVVMENRSEAMCVMRTDEGENHIVACPLTTDELLAHKRHPDTFFGKVDGNRRA